MITHDNTRDVFEAVAQTILNGVAVELPKRDLASLLDDMTDPVIFDPEDVIAPLLAATLARLRDPMWERELQQSIQSATGGAWVLLRPK
jgi:hypothetical protein